MSYDDILIALEYINSDKLDKNEILLDDNEIVETIRPRYNAKIV